jgi:hypothetical protein
MLTEPQQEQVSKKQDKIDVAKVIKVRKGQFTNSQEEKSAIRRIYKAFNVEFRSSRPDFLNMGTLPKDVTIESYVTSAQVQ